MEGVRIINNWSIIILMAILSGGACLTSLASSNVAGYDTTRIYHAMDRARQGEDITIAVIGGSITQGYAASTEAQRWTNLMADWWVQKFPESKITLINAGIGGTGSDIGTHRLQADVLRHDPDFIVVEFSVNDGSPGEHAQKMMEGLVRQGLTYEKLPGIMLLALMQENGATAQASHKLVADHYQVPIVSFADSIELRLDRDGRTLSDIFLDGVHPNDEGMQYIADFLNEELELIHNTLPDAGNLPGISTDIPDPQITEIYQHCYMYSTSDLVPLSNSGWTEGSVKWSADESGSEISFELDGNAISLIYTRHNVNSRGQVDVWIDDGTPQTLDAYWTETWGPGQVFALIQENLADGKHILHIRVNENNTGGGDEHFFEILNVCKAGNWTGIAPIGESGENRKVVIGTPVELDGSESFAPDSSDIISYLWNIETAPAGSSAEIDNPTNAFSSFTPDIAGNYRIGLVVAVEGYESIKDIKSVHAKASNAAPIADAGNDTLLANRTFHFLNGLNSYDPDGDELSYSWTLVSMPGDQKPNTNFMNTAEPKIYLTDLGEYVFSLMVNDSIVSSEEDLITITAADATGLMQFETDRPFGFYCYPKPAQDYQVVNFKLESSQRITISLYSIKGQLISNEIDQIFTQGEHSVQLMLENKIAPKKPYVIQLNSQDHTLSEINFRINN